MPQASPEEQSGRIKIALRFWAQQGKTMATIGGRVASDEQRKNLGELAKVIEQATELIEKL